jgi:hypothetical protein
MEEKKGSSPAAAIISLLTDRHSLSILCINRFTKSIYGYRFAEQHRT